MGIWNQAKCLDFDLLVLLALLLLRYKNENKNHFLAMIKSSDEAMRQFKNVKARFVLLFFKSKVTQLKETRKQLHKEVLPILIVLLMIDPRICREACFSDYRGNR